MKYIALFALTLSATTFGFLFETPTLLATGQLPKTPLAADKLWSSLSASIEGIATPVEAAQKWGRYSSEYRRWIGQYRTQYRDQGIEFWHQFPLDVRWHKWFRETAGFEANLYWTDSGQNCSKVANNLSNGNPAFRGPALRQQYVILRSAYMAEPTVTREEKMNIKQWEITARGSQLTAKISQNSDHPYQALIKNAPDIWQLTNDSLDFAADLASLPRGFGSQLVAITSHDFAMESTLLDAMKRSKAAELRDYARARTDLLVRLRERPVELRLSTLQKSELDLSKFRGKVVLIEFWDVYCEGCIAAMPKLESAYKKYRNAGFEIVDIYIVWNPEDREEERSRAMEILRKQGITYQTGVLDPWLSGNKMTDDPTMLFFDLWGAGGFSFLLDQEGRLVTTDISGNWLEFEVRRLLKLSPIPFVSSEVAAD